MQAPWMDALPMNTNVWVSGDKNLEQEVLAADTRPQELITDCEATPRPRSIQRGDGTAWREWRWRRRDRGYHDQVDVNVEEEEDSEEGSSDDPEWQGGGRDPVRESGGQSSGWDQDVRSSFGGQFRRIIHSGCGQSLGSASAVDAVAVAAEAASGSGDRPTAASRGSARTFDWPGLTSQVPRPPPPRPQDVRPHGTEQQCGRLQSQGHQQNPQQGAVLVAAATGDGWCRRDPSFDDDPK